MHEGIIFPPYSPSYTLSSYPPLFHWYQAPQTGPVLPSCSLFLKQKLSKIALQIKWMREKTQINKIRDEKGNIATYTNEIQRPIRKYSENLHSSKLENLHKIDKCLDAYI
jgi:hypothetical protein